MSMRSLRMASSASKARASSGSRVCSSSTNRSSISASSLSSAVPAAAGGSSTGAASRPPAASNSASSFCSSAAGAAASVRFSTAASRRPFRELTASSSPSSIGLAHHHAAVTHQAEQVFRPVRHGFHAVERHRPRQPLQRMEAAEQPRHVARLAFGRAQAHQQRLEHGQMLVAFRRELLPERLDELVHGVASGGSASRCPTPPGRARAHGARPARSRGPSWPGDRGSWRPTAWR